MSYLYSDSDITLLKKNSGQIRDKLDKIKNESIDPTLDEQKKIIDLIRKYCIENKRKIYGGYAWNLLLINKNPSDKIYSDDHVADIDIYSPEPIKDWYNICNLLHQNGFKYILGEEAQHKETYSVKVYRKVFCDISYVPKNIYNRIPFIEINGLYCTHPNFITIDYLRMSSDILSYWRFFDCGDDLKSFKRFYKIQRNYPLPHSAKPLKDLVKPKPKAEEGLNIIYKYLLNKKSVVVMGFYAYNYFCHYSNYDYVYIPFYEFISSNFREDALELIQLLKKSMEEDQITCDEFYPFFQFTDYSVEIYVGNDIICRIYNDNKKCIQYQDLPAINFNENKPSKSEQNIRLGSFSIILLHFLVDATRMRVKNDKDMEKFYFLCVSHSIQMRNEYLTKYNKTFLDDSIFQEFKMDCMGKLISPELERMILIEKRKKQKKPIIHRYIPGEKDDKEPPKYNFANSSGNKIINPKNLKLKDKTEDVNENENEDEEEEITPDSDSESELNLESKVQNENQEGGGNIYHKNVQQPYFDQIKNGTKKFEGRLKKEEFAKGEKAVTLADVKKDDIVIWKNDSDEIKSIVTDILKFDTFVDAISYVGLINILPSEAKERNSIQKAIDNVYRQFYSEEDEKKYGVILIEIKLAEQEI